MSDSSLDIIARAEEHYAAFDALVAALRAEGCEFIASDRERDPVLLCLHESGRCDQACVHNKSVIQSGMHVLLQVCSDARMVSAMWRYCQELCSKVGRHFDALRSTALLLLLELFTSAAAAAIDMQRSAAAAAATAAAVAAAAEQQQLPGTAAAIQRAGSSGSEGANSSVAGSSSSVGGRSVAALSAALGDISDYESGSDEDQPSGAIGSSVWGAQGQGLGRAGRRGLAGCRGGLGLWSPSDEDVQAQAWLPQLLIGLLHWSNVTARQVRCQSLHITVRIYDYGGLYLWCSHLQLHAADTTCADACAKCVQRYTCCVSATPLLVST
jgi:hypothetical protein